MALNAAFSLGAKPVLAPRLSLADSRPPHQGISHHTRTVLDATPRWMRVAFPEVADIPTEELPERHSYTRISYDAGGLEDRFGVTFRSMGRSYAEDQIFFDTAAAAAALGDRSERKRGGVRIGCCPELTPARVGWPLPARGLRADPRRAQGF